MIHLNFGSFDPRSAAGFEAALCAALHRIAKNHGLDDLQGVNTNDLLTALVEALAKTAPVVLLIDEYDLPVLRNLTSPGGAQPLIEVLSIFFHCCKSLIHPPTLHLYYRSQSLFKDYDFLRHEQPEGYFS